VLPDQHVALAEQMRTRWVIATPESAIAQLTELAATFGVDEVMVNPVAGSSDTDPANRAPARETTLRLLAGALV
jgi:alkanesulfonate monooxygenase SsuD/methylene tetrahydromethanopterin reductase-like flavin-dependent oxidoreductase (luciferase family)